jgi:ssDNA-binding replication factor A large subunit
MFSLEAMIERICEHSKIEPEKVRQMIAEKQDELSGLVSEEGAAYIIARELGLNMIRETKKQLKIKNIVSGLRNVDLVARVVNVLEERHFERDGKKGSVINLQLGDETGMIRLSLWNEETNLIKEGKIKEGDSVKVTGGWVKPDNRDNPELRVGRGSIQVIDQDIEVPEGPQIERSFGSPTRKTISEFKEGEQAIARAVLAQVFKRNSFYEICPECDARVNETEGKFHCPDHGEVKPKPALVMAGVIDDGTENIRAVFFRETAEKMFGLSTEELKAISDKASDPMEVFENVKGLGGEFLFSGRVKMNSFTESLELVVNSVEDIDVRKEISELIKSD